MIVLIKSLGKSDTTKETDGTVNDTLFICLFIDLW